MVRRVDKLTKEQEAMLQPWADKWIEIGLKTGRTEWKQAEDAILRAYDKAGINRPENIVRVQSPFVGALAASIANNHLSSVSVRDAVDDTVRVSVGDAVDAAVRVPVGVSVGVSVRDVVRDAVGVSVGDVVHDAVRVPVGVSVHATVSDAVHDAVSDAVHDAVGVAVRVLLRASVGEAVNSALRASVDSAVRVSVGDAVHVSADSAVHDTVHEAVGSAVHVSVHDAVSVSVGVSVSDAVGGAGLGWHYWLGGQFWVGGWWGSPALVSFFRDVCGLRLERDIEERADIYQQLTQSANYMWLNKKFAMICARPKHIRRDGQGLLHCDQGQAIEYPDGWGLYMLHGVRFEKELWQKIVDEEVTLENLGEIENADQRAVAVQMLRPDRLLEQVKAKLIHTGVKGTELYQVDNFMDTGETEYCMKMKHPSLDKYYIEWVQPEVGRQADADLCQAEAFGVPKAVYLAAQEA